MAVRGRLDRSRFEIGPGKLQKKTVDHFAVLEYANRTAKTATLLAPVGDAVVASDTPSRVIAALNYVRDPHPVTIRNETLRQGLAQVDQRQSLWLAAALKSLGPIARIEPFWLETILRPLLTHADSVHGGLTCTEDVRVELHFHTTSIESAARLETDLRNICEVAGGAPLLFGRDKELLPLFRLLAAGQTSREGKMVLLRCLLAEEQPDG